MELANVTTLDAIEVLDESGSKVKLGTFWKDNTAILVFLRHFGCAACRAQVQQMYTPREKIERQGTKVYFIGNGTARFLRSFKEELGYPDLRIYTDPTLEAFRAAGFYHGIWVSHRPTSLLSLGKLIAQGYANKLPNKEAGSIWELGGVLAIRPGGKIAYQYASTKIGDFPPMSALIGL